MAELRADGARVRQACHALGVSASGYYNWQGRAPSARSVRHAWLTDLIGQVHDASYGTYGQPGSTLSSSAHTESRWGITRWRC